MNIFLPYEYDIVKSVQSLDDVRLNKQVVECYQLLTSAIKEKNGESIKGHRNHPVYVFYKDNLKFLSFYGYICCCEYYNRFNKHHSLFNYLHDKCSEMLDINAYVNAVENIYSIPNYTPYYMEGSKGQPNYIRTTENVSALFQQKLIKKWEQDKAKGRQPKWTNREVPQFYQQWLKENGDGNN